jgi:hypothetical protein
MLEIYLELSERSIQQGDAFAVVCGLKEPKGYVRGLGLGITLFFIYAQINFYLVIYLIHY